MSTKAIERAFFVGGAAVAAALAAVLLISPLEVIWTTAIIFAVAAVLVGVQTVLFNRRHHDGPIVGSRKPQPHS